MSNVVQFPRQPQCSDVRIEAPKPEPAKKYADSTGMLLGTLICFVALLVFGWPALPVLVLIALLGRLR